VHADKERSLARRHPWLFASGIERVVGTPAPGETIALVDQAGGFIAWAAWSPQSSIRARIWSFDPADRIDDAWFAARVQRAVARRRHLRHRTDAIRLVCGGD
jgi:23S rRNA (cytosine1962-C5)-methyltransferase